MGSMNRSECDTPFLSSMATELNLILGAIVSNAIKVLPKYFQFNGHICGKVCKILIWYGKLNVLYLVLWWRGR